MREILINRLNQMVDCQFNQEQLQKMGDCDLLDEYERLSELDAINSCEWDILENLRDALAILKGADKVYDVQLASNHLIIRTKDGASFIVQVCLRNKRKVVSQSVQ